tara:strand:+ start:1084 stop:2007 length:924 start_codon:yes stop_codon:yes gene_type:complete
MDLPRTGVLLSKNCFVWSNSGLLKVDEIRIGDQILCVDHIGEISAFLIEETPKLHGPGKVVEIITNNGRTYLPLEGEIFVRGGKKKISDIEKNDEIMVLGKKEINSIKSILDSSIDDRLGLDEIESAAFASYEFKVKGDDETVFRVKSGIEEFIQNSSILQEKYDATIMHQHDQVIIKSKTFAYISEYFIEKKIPEILRRSRYSVMKAYFDQYVYKKIKVDIENLDLIVFLQIMALFENKSVKKKIRGHDVTMIISDEEVQSRNFSRIINHSKSLAPVFRIPMNSNWDAIIDNVLVGKHLISYNLES